jgi:citrate lyase subunit beta/citryl-CoA lyase
MTQITHGAAQAAGTAPGRSSLLHAASYLFVPGNRPDRYERACATNAGAVIVDLEDAVPAPEKSAARDMLSNWMSPVVPVLVRINAADTEWFEDDIAMCIACGAAGIVLPKAEGGGQIAAIAAHANGTLPVLPMIESARGFWHVVALAGCAGVQRLMFGSIDFQLDLGIDSDDHDELLHFRSQLVLASRLAGLAQPVDGVTTAIHDAQRLQEDAMRARRLGFGAKCCIHPDQVDIVNRYMAPSAEQLAWARKVIDAARNARGAVATVDGQMVDKPVYARAAAFLARSQGNPTPLM